MAKISFIFVAIALTFSTVLCQTEATYGKHNFLYLPFLYINLSLFFHITAVSSSAPGYKVDGKVLKTKGGLQIPLTLNSNKQGVDMYGKTIQDLLVDVEYETEDRLHVKVKHLFMHTPQNTHNLFCRSRIKTRSNIWFQTLH